MGGRPRKEVEFDVLISGYAPEYSHTVREYLALLELPMPADESKDIVLSIKPTSPRNYSLDLCACFGPSASPVRRIRGPPPLYLPFP